MVGISRKSARGVLPRQLALSAAGALAVAGLLGAASTAGAAASKHTVSFSTAGQHVFKVPKNVTHITVTATGAAGGSCSPSAGGALGGEGASLTATVSVKPGAKLFVGVGGLGGACIENLSSSSTVPGGAGGAEGGGAGGSGGLSGVSGAGGGGASGVALKSLGHGGSPLVVAAGGGGASYCAGTGGNAGSAGLPGSTCDVYYGQGGAAGTASGGGSGGAPGSYSNSGLTYDGVAGASGTAGAGGNGGIGAPNAPSASGGGGGGGYYGGGGGGGGGPVSGGGGGGGGASFTAKHASHVSAPTATTASASVTITYVAAPRPRAITKRATGVSGSRANLHGSVNGEGLKTTYAFQYGTSKRYGKSTSKHGLSASTSARGVAAVLTGLKPNTTYHFRVVAESASGKAYGRDMTFHTASVAPAFTG